MDGFATTCGTLVVAISSQGDTEWWTLSMDQPLYGSRVSIRSISVWIQQHCLQINTCNEWLWFFIENMISIDHCADNVKNQDEEGIDCGGTCARACTPGCPN